MSDHQPGAPRPTRSETLGAVLVVDDEPLVRSLTAEVLRDDYDVVEACSAEQAMAHLKQVPAFDLVISDIRMPGSMDGFGLARWLRINHPTIPILLISGYHETASVPLDAPPILPKPFTHDRLLDQVAKMIARGREANQASMRRCA
ncbi:MAG: response regulator [Proteobacteria bacterium]|nr:response regulator [Pseudomonadota bacterium]